MNTLRNNKYEILQRLEFHRVNKNQRKEGSKPPVAGILYFVLILLEKQMRRQNTRCLQVDQKIIIQRSLLLLIMKLKLIEMIKGHISPLRPV